MAIFGTPRLQPEGLGLERFPTSLGERLGAEGEEGVEGLPLVELTDTARLLGAAGTQAPIGNPMGDYEGPFDPAEEARQNAAQLPDVPIADARAKVKEAGLEPTLKLPDQPTIKAPALDIMIDRANRRREREATIARAPQGFVPGALSFGTGFFLPLLDPLNDAAFMIPAVGEARTAKLMAAAGDSLAQRAGARFAVGAAQGAVGTAALQPLEAWARTQEGQDFTAAEAVRNVLMGAGLAGTMHGAGGLVGDAWRRATGRPLPYAPDLTEARRQPSDKPAGPVSGGVSEPESIAASPEIEPSLPAAIVQALPPTAHRDAMQGALASLIDGEPVQAQQHLEAAARRDPRVADGLAQVDKIAGVERPPEPALDPQAAVGDDWRALASARGLGDAEEAAASRDASATKELESVGTASEPEPQAERAGDATLTDEWRPLSEIPADRAHIPGWDVPHDAGSAPRSGGAVAATSGRSEGAGAGGRARAAGERDPAAAGPRSEATRAAIAAEERAAADFAARGGDDTWQFLNGETLGDALAAIDRDTIELSQIVSRGAACLAAAMGA